jgi:hypothetical protein
MVPYSKAHSKGKVHKNKQNRYEAQPSEFSINGKMLAKTKHKKFWKFY